MAPKIQNGEGVTAEANLTAANSGTGGQTAISPQVSAGTIIATRVAGRVIDGVASIECKNTSAATGFAFARIALGSGVRRVTIKARFRVATPGVAGSYIIVRNTGGTAVAQVQMATNRRPNLVITGVGTIYTAPTALTVGTDYDIWISVDSTLGKVAFWITTTAGAYAGGMSAPYESTGRDLVPLVDYLGADVGKCSNNTDTVPVLFDLEKVYENIYGAGPLAPTADPGPTITVQARDLVTLTGTGTDPDGTISGGTWTQVVNSGDPVVTLGGSGLTRTFTAPALTADRTLTFQLVVTGTSGTSVAAQKLVNVREVTETVFVGGSEVPVLWTRV